MRLTDIGQPEKDAAPTDGNWDRIPRSPQRRGIMEDVPAPRNDARDGAGHKPPVTVPAEDADLIRKVRRILRPGKNVEIRQDTSGHPKVFRVSREIEQ